MSTVNIDVDVLQAMLWIIEDDVEYYSELSDQTREKVSEEAFDSIILMAQRETG